MTWSLPKKEPRGCDSNQASKGWIFHHIWGPRHKEHATRQRLWCQSISTGLPGGIQHPKDGREEKLGWCWEKALSQLHVTWPEMPPFTLPALPVLLLKAWVPALCQHLRDLSVFCTAPKPHECATEPSPRHFTREWQKDQDWSSPLSILLGFNDFQCKGKVLSNPSSPFQTLARTWSSVLARNKSVSPVYLDSAMIKWNSLGFSRENLMQILPQAMWMFSDVGFCVEIWLIAHPTELEMLGACSR